MFEEKRRRSFIKMISWRIWATLTTVILVYVFVGELKIVAIIGTLDVVIKMVLYYLHERAWNKINIGRESRKLP